MYHSININLFEDIRYIWNSLLSYNFQEDIAYSISNHYKNLASNKFHRKYHLIRLEDRWKQGITRFAKELIKSSKFSDVFCPREDIPMELRRRPIFKVRRARTEQFRRRNPINTFIRILNESEDYKFEFEEWNSTASCDIGIHFSITCVLILAWIS